MSKKNYPKRQKIRNTGPGSGEFSTHNSASFSALDAGKAAGETVELDISSVAFGGKGLGKDSDGKVYFVQGALPGDRVLCQLEKNKKKFAEGFVSRLIEKSLLRQDTRCQVFGECGGCQWLGVDYQKQLEWKKDFVASSLKRIGKISSVSDLSFDGEVNASLNTLLDGVGRGNASPRNVSQPSGSSDTSGTSNKSDNKNHLESLIKISGSPEVLNYRSRVMIRVHLDQTGTSTFGFFKMRSRELVSIRSCDIAGSKIGKLIDYFTGFRSEKMANDKFRMEVQEIPAALTDEQSLIVCLTPAVGRHQDLTAVIDFLNESDLVRWVGVKAKNSVVPSFLFESDLGIDFYLSPGQFYQVNIEHNKNLRRLVKRIVDRAGPQSIYDLYCGSGNLSLPLYAKGRSIIGVEMNPVAIENAQISVKNTENLEAYADAFEYVAMDAGKHLRSLAQAQKTFDLIILDPPREGVTSGLEDLLNLKAKDIIYVSCDPVTLARDLKSILAAGYFLRSVDALDFFPNTYHIESVVHLTKN